VVFSEHRRRRLKKLTIDPFTDDAVAVEEKGGLVRLIHKIWEGDTRYPAVTHIFTGTTREEAQGYFDSHMKTDKFLAAMETKKRWKSIVGRVKQTWR
jgi:hypothetical protein